MRILLILLTLFSFSFALAPAGVKAFQIITINSSQVAETNTHFLFQIKIPCTGAVIANCTSSVNVVVYKSDIDTTKVPKWVVYTADTLFLYADVAVSTIANSSYVVGYGKAVNTANSSSTFTNCGITNFWGFDEPSGTSTVDFAGGQTGTISSPANRTTSGIFYKNIQFVNTSPSGISHTQEIIGSGNRSISFSIVRGAETGTLQRLFYNGKVEITLNNTNNGTVSFTNNGTITVASFGNAFPNIGQRYFAMFTRSSTGDVDLYVNGAKVSTTQSGGATVVGTVGLKMGSLNGALPSNAAIDNVEFTSTIRTIEYHTTQYNMLFTPATLSTLGAVKSISTSSDGKSSAFKSAFKWQAFKSAFR